MGKEPVLYHHHAVPLGTGLGLPYAGPAEMACRLPGRRRGSHDSP